MYRKPDGTRGFSFTKFANAAVPNFFSDPSPSTLSTLHPLRKDILYNHQLTSPDFRTFDPLSLHVSGIASSPRLSRSLYKSLRKAEVLDETGRVVTRNVGPRFMHQVPQLTTREQRELVGLLFWWEEEVMRLEKLVGEERELGGLILEAEGPGEDGEGEGEGGGSRGKEELDRLRFARERVRMKIRMRPSQRREDLEMDRDGIVEGAWGGGRRDLGGDHPGVGLMSVRTEDGVERGELPDYAVVAAR